MGWEDTIKPVESTEGGWEDTIKPFTEDDGMAAATLAADKKFSDEDWTETESALGGLAQGLNFGLGDESAGFVTAMRNTLFGDRLAKDFPESYRISRDLARDKYKGMQKTNPKSFFGGQMVGGAAHVANPLLQAGKGASIAKQIGTLGLEGGLYGYGETEEETPGGQLKDTLKGSALGVTGGALAAGDGMVARNAVPAAKSLAKVPGAVGRGVARVPGSIARAPKNLWNSRRTFIEGAGNPEIKGLPDLAKTTAGVWEVVKSLTDTASKKQEFSKMLSTNKAINFKGTDEEFVLSELLADGSNPIKDWVADKSASLLPGQIDSQMLKRVLNIPMDKRSAARQFDRREAGEELLPEITSAYDATKKASGEAYERLTGEAKELFEDVGDAPMNMLKKNLDFAEGRESIGGNVKSVLRDAMKDIGEDFPQLSPQQQFDRLQKVRGDLGDMVDWTKKNELPQGQKVISKAYDSLNDWLQASDNKMEGDALYSTFKSFEDDLFKQVATVNRGRIKDFDSIKLEKLFKESDSGRRLMKQISRAKKAVSDGELAADDATTLYNVIKKVEEIKDLADSKKLVDAFRFKMGPSSPAVQRQAAAMKGSKPLQEAMESPSGFIHSADQFFPPEAKKRFGKDWNELGPEDRQKLIRLWMWNRKDPEAFPAKIEAAWKAINKM